MHVPTRTFGIGGLLRSSSLPIRDLDGFPGEVGGWVVELLER